MSELAEIRSDQFENTWSDGERGETEELKDINCHHFTSGPLIMTDAEALQQRGSCKFTGKMSPHKTRAFRFSRV